MTKSSACFLTDISATKLTYEASFKKEDAIQRSLVHRAIFECLAQDDAVEFIKINTFLDELNISGENSFARLCDTPHEDRTVFQYAAEHQKYNILTLLGLTDVDFNGGRPTFTNKTNKQVPVPLEFIFRNDDLQAFELVKNRILRNGHSRLQYLPSLFDKPLENQAVFLNTLLEYENQDPEKSSILYPNKLSKPSIKACLVVYKKYKEGILDPVAHAVLEEKLFNGVFLEKLEQEYQKKASSKRGYAQMEETTPAYPSSSRSASLLSYFTKKEEPPEKKGCIQKQKLSSQ